MQNAPMGFRSKSQRLCIIYALHYPHVVFLQLLPPCEMSKLLLNLQALGSLPDPPTTQLLPCTHSPVGPAVALHSTWQVPVSMSAAPMRLGLYLFIFPSSAQRLSCTNQCLLSVCLPLFQLKAKLRHFISQSHFMPTPFLVTFSPTPMSSSPLT